MSNTQAVATSFKQELMLGYHAFGNNPARVVNTPDTFKAALYLATASIGASTAAYSATGEVSGTGYSAGGVTVTNANAPATGGSTAYWTPSAAFSWTGVTLSSSFDCVLIYNSSQGNRAVASFTFSGQTVTAGNFTLNMPTNNASSGLIRLS